MKSLSLLCLLVFNSIAQMGLTENGRFRACPKKPNCVSSMEEEQKRYIAPIKHKLSKEQAKKVIKTVIENRSRMSIIFEKENYLAAQEKSKVFGFIDEVEFLFQDDLIHIKSASQTGYYDFGVNRDRVEALRFEFFQTGGI